MFAWKNTTETLELLASTMHFFNSFLKSNHNFDFNSAKMLIYIYNKRLKRIFEAGVISLCNSVNTRLGFYNISPYLSKSILNS